jgi:hypothetical protein
MTATTTSGAPPIFTGEGPNACECGHGLPGTSHWSDEAVPTATCPACGLHYVLEDRGVAIYASGDYAPALVGFAPSLRLDETPADLVDARYDAQVA